MALPSGYTRVEYIESTGAQYIDTGYKPNSNMQIVTDGQFISSSGSQFLYGARTSSYTVNFSFLLTGGNFRSDYGESSRISISASSLTDRMIVEQNKNLCYIDGTLKATNTESSFESEYNMYLFALNEAETVRYYASARIYSCQIYDNGTLVRNYIPCVEVASGTAGLYDTVNDVFYGSNSSTAFEAGASVTYMQAEYIETSGSQYIDTGYKPNSNTRIVMDMQLTSSPSANAAIFGVRETTNVKHFWVYYRPAIAGFVCLYGSADNINANLVLEPVERYTIDMNMNAMTIGNQTVSCSEDTFSSTNNAYLFAVNRVGTAQYISSMRLYSCQIYDNGTLVRDFIPCIEKSTGVVGLYDKVTCVLYEFKGSGDVTVCIVKPLNWNENVNGVVTPVIGGYENVEGVLKRILKTYQNIDGVIVPTFTEDEYVYNVTPDVVTYTWKKYTVKETTSTTTGAPYTETSSPVVSTGWETSDSTYCMSSYTFNSTTGQYTLTGSGKQLKTSQLTTDYPYWRMRGTTSSTSKTAYTIYEYSGTKTLQSDGTYNVLVNTLGQKGTETTTTKESAGDYIEDVTSTDSSAYPTNGKHTDGYWYVKQ